MNKETMKLSHDVKTLAVIRIIAVILLIAAMFLTCFTAERGIEIIKHIAAPAAFALIGVTLYLGGYFKRVYLAAILLAFWYALTRALNGDHYLTTSYYNVVVMAIALGVCFPFAARLEDRTRQSAMRLITGMLVVFLAALAWLSVIAVIRGRTFVMPLFGRQIGFNEVYHGATYRLNVLDLHPNYSAALFAVGLLLSCWLMLRIKKCWAFILFTLTSVGFYAAVALTASRTAMVGLALSAAGIALILGIRLIKLKSTAVKALLLAVIVGASACAAYLGFDLAISAVTGLAKGTRAQAAEAQTEAPAADTTELTAEDINVKRDIIKDLSTLTLRTSIYATIIPTIEARPVTLIIGTLEEHVMDVSDSITGIRNYHFHNSFAQTLIVAGIPGLLLALWLTVELVVASLRLFFARGGIVPLAQRMLPIVPLYLLLHGMLENYLFVNTTPIALIFCLISGYVLTVADKLPKGAWRKRA